MVVCSQKFVILKDEEVFNRNQVKFDLLAMGDIFW